MKRLKVTHFLQDDGCCSVAACATAANYYNPEIDYRYAKKVADKIQKDINDGLDSGEIGILLNRLGFHKVTIVTSDLDLFDYEWEHYGRRKLTETMRLAISRKKCKISKEQLMRFYEWYTDRRYENIIKIGLNFGTYIKKKLNRRKPVIISFNWSMFMKFPKQAEKGGADPINGDEEFHSVVLNGYDKNGVWVVDSHQESYKYKRKKYRRGFYKMSWENLFTCMGSGDVYLPEDYY